MSHFTVLVITPEKPDDDDLHKILLPWHEYECTGYEEYLTDVDITDGVKEAFDREKSVVVLADGKVFGRYDDRFYTKESTDDIDRRLDRKQFELPPGAEEKTLTADEARAQGVGLATMAAAADYEYGESAFERDGRWYRKTNPNKKWDWWQIGGRWSGHLINGGPCDQAQLSSIDMNAMLEAARSRIRTAWNKAFSEYSGKALDCDFSEALTKWNVALAAAKAKQAAGAIGPLYQLIDAEPEAKDGRPAYQAADWNGVPEGSTTLEEALTTAKPFVPFAVVKDGQWFERGKMGWWAVVMDEKESDAWDSEVSKLLADLPPTSWLTVVDCHI